MDLYIVLGSGARRDGGRHQAGLPSSCAAVSSGHQSGRPRGGGALPADPRRLRDVDRSAAAVALRRRRGRRVARPTPKSGFEGFDFSARGVDHSATFGDLFAEVLSERGSRGPARGARRRSASGRRSSSFEEALRGTPADGHGRRGARTCRACAGTRRDARRARGPCHLCQGTGAVRSVRGHMVFSRSCTACGGTGRAASAAVRALRRRRPGDARRDGARCGFPPGIADGERVRVPGKGNAGIRGGPPGDLYITVHVAPHPSFRRDGDDLHMVVPIAIHEAALGARVDIADAGRRRRGCACRRGRSRGSGSGCASAARRRRATAAAATWSSRCG